MERLNRQDVLKKVRSILALDCACAEKYFDREGVFIFPAQKLSGRRRFPFRENFLFVMTLGHSVIVTCDENRIEWVEKNLGILQRDEVFSAQVIAKLVNYVANDQQILAGPDLKYICSHDSFRAYDGEPELSLYVYEEEEVKSLYKYQGFQHALSYWVDRERPDILAVAAALHGRIVGIAAATEDSEMMWQIGVDVLPGYRVRGIGRTVVSKLTEEILKRNKIPYYSTAISNIQSRKVAVSLGYWPGWIEMYAR